jgi:ubiquinone/menaquinone biosynthesis C-methylase UbiE
MFDKKISHEDLKKYFETGKLEGQKVNDKWQVTQKSINIFMKILAKERAQMVGPFTLDISRVKLEGRILDIGGGGEGVIGQIKKEQVIAIDKKKNELEKAPKSGDLKIIMDAKDMKFLDNTFDTVTAFFSMMYVPFSDHNVIFQEIWRVLKKDGEFLLWDVSIPNRTNESKDIYGVNLNVKIPEKIIETGYGVYWVRKKDAEYYKKVSKNTGFKILEQKVENQIFFLRFIK